jgi:hypothetical protein
VLELKRFKGIVPTLRELLVDADRLDRVDRSGIDSADPIAEC